MRDRRRLLLLVLVTFAAAIAGVVIGRVYVVPVRPVENELHELLHRDLNPVLKLVGHPLLGQRYQLVHYLYDQCRYLFFHHY